MPVEQDARLFRETDRGDADRRARGRAAQAREDRAVRRGVSHRDRGEERERDLGRASATRSRKLAGQRQEQELDRSIMTREIPFHLVPVEAWARARRDDARTEA